jgi:hypothetical protein
VVKSQRALDGATKRFNDFERADAKRTEESKAAKAKAKKLRTKRDKDAAALQVCLVLAPTHTQHRRLGTLFVRGCSCNSSRAAEDVHV